MLKRKLGIYPDGVVPLKIREKYLSDPEFPYLISFPRTGSHWLRMMMELYFERPSMSLVFYNKKNTDYTCYHRHDTTMDLIDVNNVLYLYRQPTDTIYSQMKYDKIDSSDESRVMEIATQYRMHLSKWLYDEAFTQKKAVITYESLRDDLVTEFKVVTDFFNQSLDKEKIINVSSEVSKSKIQSKTSYDKQVIQVGKNYDADKKLFISKYAAKIKKHMIDQDLRLENIIL